ncbi:Sad1 interacting factor 1 protein [Lasiodiplodia theobromae]|uniref:Sad1 interacting factor 1 protein n=1 Tax=Lasiodiplodia theobromae TaxID=45133 RepID=UPI0015C2D845|nr:Sad1 interacting factor 1 protein [Lasiodiplodia theobromae]KAF4544571.1 Sad1 interacting factor 1 protein [Lasiodiplodia theobromae]
MEAPQESDAQRRARERRERRQAKIASQGASRLEAITSLSGRPAPAVEDATPAPSKPAAEPTTTTTNAPAATTTTTTHHDTTDPPEVDISEHYYQPTPRRLPPSASASGASTPFGPASGRDSPAVGGGGGGGNMDDPMMLMMQQMLRGGDAGGQPGGGGGAPGAEDPMMKMMQAMMGGGAPGQAAAQQQQQKQTSSAYVWRIVHAVFSFGLAAYVALTSTFDGSKLSRSASAFGQDHDEEAAAVGRRLFYIFATVEVLLQTTRFFVERGQLQQGGIMGTLATVLPEPFAGYVRLAGRYSVIYTTVVADAMVVVFVLGAMAWWKGMVVN